ncbi:MAG: hypothetical protein ACTXOO_02125 [Sodalis sp. (in: enterobacteria)]
MSISTAEIDFYPPQVSEWHSWFTDSENRVSDSLIYNFISEKNSSA